MKEVILDTDTVSYLFRQHPNVVEKVRKYTDIHDFMNISLVTYYEVMNGLYYRDAKRQMAVFQQFADDNSILPLNREIADISAKIFADLKSTGQSIGHTDTLIAGTAIHNDMILITNNTRHFRRVEGLQFESWAI